MSQASSKREESEKIAKEATEIASRVEAATSAPQDPTVHSSAVNAAESKDSSVVPPPPSTSVGTKTTETTTIKVAALQPSESRAGATETAAVPAMTKPAAPPTNEANTLTKKRKLGSDSPPVAAPPPSRPPPVASSRPMPLINPVIAKTVHDIMGLLQTYGPLSLAQLEYNLPPCNVLQDVLQVMATLGVVQVVEDSSINVHQYATKYCIAYGKPRADILLPQNVVQDILDAQDEIKKSQQQSDLLKKALLSPTCNAVEARQLLKSILLKNPLVGNDPVYMAAFRNLHVDVAGAERERHMQERSCQSGGKTEKEDKSTKGTNADTLQKKQSQSLTAGTKLASNNGASQPIPSHQKNQVPTSTS